MCGRFFGDGTGFFGSDEICVVVALEGQARYALRLSRERPCYYILSLWVTPPHHISERCRHYLQRLRLS